MVKGASKWDMLNLRIHGSLKDKVFNPMVHDLFCIPNWFTIEEQTQENLTFYFKILQVILSSAQRKIGVFFSI